MIIRIILIVAIISALAWFLKQRTSTKGQAGSKLGALLLFTFAAITVIYPGITNDIAHSVGVGRGADLLLYCLTVAFLVTLLANYLHHQDEHLKTIRLARRIAILEAKREDHNKDILEKLNDS